MNFYDFFFFRCLRLFGLVDPSLLGLLVEEHDSVQQPVGLICADTIFTQSWIVRSEIAKSAHWISSWGFVCKQLRFVAYVNIAPHQSAQVIIQCGTRYVDFFIFKASRSVRSVRPFPIFDSTFDLIPDSASKTVKAWYRQSFHSKPPNIPAYRPGDPGVFHSRCQGFMDPCHTPRSCSDVKFLDSHPFYIDYLMSVNSKLNFIKILTLIRCLCGFFFYVIKYKC